MLVLIHEIDQLNPDCIVLHLFLVEILLQVEEVFPQCHELNFKLFFVIKSFFQLVLQILNRFGGPFFFQVHLEHVIFSVK